MHTEVSAKSADIKTVDIIVKDKYGQKITKTNKNCITEKVTVNV